MGRERLLVAVRLFYIDFKLLCCASFDVELAPELRTTLYDGTVSLTGIWGADPSEFYVVGYMDDKLLRCSHDPITGEFTKVEVDVIFPANKALDSGPAVDKFGRPLF